MRAKRILLTFALLTMTSLGFSQSSDFGAIAGFEYENDFARFWSLSAESDIKFNNMFSSYDRFKIGASVNRSFFRKHVKLSIGGDYINKDETTYYESRFRLNTSLSASQKIRQFKFSYRARFQGTFRDEQKGDYRVNPKYYMRNRAEAEYTFIHKPIKLSLSSEFFWRLNNPTGNIIDNVRTVFSVRYRFNADNSMTFFLRADNEVQVNDPVNAYYIGVTYSISQ